MCSFGRTSLPLLVPRLWPFFGHPSSSVRKSAVLTLSQLVSTQVRHRGARTHALRAFRAPCYRACPKPADDQIWAQTWCTLRIPAEADSAECVWAALLFVQALFYVWALVMSVLCEAPLHWEIPIVLFEAIALSKC